MNLRRLLWTVLIAALAAMLLMQYLYHKPAESSKNPAASAPASRPASSTAPATAPTAGPGAAATSAAASKHDWRNDIYPLQEVMLGSLDTHGGYRLRVQLTSRGAAISTVKLTDYFISVADKRRYQRNPTAYDKAVDQDPNLGGHYSLMNPVGPTGDRVFSMCTLRIGLVHEKLWLDLSGDRWRAGPVETDANGTQRVTFSSEIYRDGRPYVRVEKTYSLAKDSYSVGVNLKTTNLSGVPAQVRLTQIGPTGVPREDLQADRRHLDFARLVQGDVKLVKRSVLEAKKVAVGLLNGRPIGRSDDADPVVWAGLTNKFFAALLYLKPPPEEQALADPEARAEFFEAAEPESPESKVFLAGVELGGWEVPAGGDAGVDMDLFAGPKQRDLFDNNPLYSRLRYKDTLDFGSCCSWAPLTLGMMWLLEQFSKVTFGNYGLAIILLVVLVRLALHPLTKKSQVSMMGMQKLQPEVARIREKYKDDKAKQNEEMMKVYKQHGFSPMLGCLPMLLQMPIWIALWTGLSAAVELRQTAFLPFWIVDLAAPDQLISFGGKGFHVPLLDQMVGPIYGLNLLPLLWGAMLYFQQKMTPAPASGADQQAKSQRQMMNLMSVMFCVMFYNGPSGLTLYLVASTGAGVVEQYVIRKHIRQKQAAEAAAETRIEMPGGFRGHKPKKPKGPFRF